MQFLVQMPWAFERETGERVKKDIFSLFLHAVLMMFGGSGSWRSISSSQSMMPSCKCSVLQGKAPLVAEFADLFQGAADVLAVATDAEQVLAHHASGYAHDLRHFLLRLLMHVV